MIKKILCSIALAAALVPFVHSAQAQNYKGRPKPAISDYGPFPQTKSKSPTTAVAKAEKRGSKPSSSTCGNPAGPCLFYGGDFLFDPLYPPSLANGLANEDNLLVGGTPYGAATWVPFTVPEGHTWKVTGLFTNNLSAYGVLDQAPLVPEAAAYWSINQGVEPGFPGTVVASGISPASSTPTGRGAFALNEYTVQVTGLSFDLTAGRYWMIVVPLCTNAADPYCSGVFFLSDVEYLNVTPTNAIGPPEPTGASFFDSPYFGSSFTPTNGPLGQCAGSGCDAFSAGVLGKKAK